jgi:hypothetical protein
MSSCLCLARKGAFHLLPPSLPFPEPLFSSSCALTHKSNFLALTNHEKPFPRNPLHAMSRTCPAARDGGFGFLPSREPNRGHLCDRDQYWMNPLARLSPDGNPSFTAPIQPIRNGDLGNLALDLLGLGPIPGSTINSTQNLLTATPEFAGLAPGIGLLLSAGLMRRQRRRVLPLPPTGSNCTSSSRHEPSPLNG